MDSDLFYSEMGWPVYPERMRLCMFLLTFLIILSVRQPVVTMIFS